MLARSNEPTNADAALAPTAPAGTRGDAFDRAQRHSRRVRVLKFAVPVLAAGIAVAFPVYSYFAAPVSISIQADGTAFANGKLVMANPKLNGFTKQKLPYSLTALRAIQDVGKQDIIQLEGIHAKLPLTADNVAVVDASSFTTAVEKNPTLMHAAIDGGRAAFRINCSACHGSGAAGSKGYPNLNDDDWLWGGDIKSIQQTLLDGVRFPGDDNTRMSQMPAFGKDEILKADEVQDVVSYVRFISHQEAASPSAKRGSAIFANNCAVCHGPNGGGNRTVGAPNLTDKIWLYGGDRDTLTQTVTNARYGIMPAWGQKLDPVTLKMVAVYVHSLGGGEAIPATAPAATVAAK